MLLGGYRKILLGGLLRENMKAIVYVLFLVKIIIFQCSPGVESKSG